MSGKRIVDAALTALLLCLIAYQVTGEALHEWLGVTMTALVIVHQILNRKWYGALFRGRYNAYCAAATALNALLLAAFALTAFCARPSWRTASMPTFAPMMKRWTRSRARVISSAASTNQTPPGATTPRGARPWR